MSNNSNQHRVEHTALKQFVMNVLQSEEVRSPHADILADALVRADLRGVDSHGVSRLETYIKKFENGGFNKDPEIEFIQNKPSTILVDADDGPGQSAGSMTIEKAMEVAAEKGVAAAAVRNSNHFGTAAYYTEKASANDFIGVSMTNVLPDVIPYGGTEAFLGTNPISFSIPTDRDFSITLDMATSVVAMGKIQEVARKEGTAIPPEWAVDENSDPTTDPNEAVAARPLGGPKGYGLAVVVDVLSGLLSGAGPSPSVNPLYDNFDEPMKLGNFFMVIDIASFREISQFKSEIGTYIDQLKAVPTQDDVGEIKLPGEIETKKLQRQEKEGIEMKESTIETLHMLSNKYDVPMPNLMN